MVKAHEFEFINSMSIRIGIVDDQKKIRDNLETRFSFFDGIDVVMLAQNGKDAIKQLKSMKKDSIPTVLLMDIEMPVMDGVETTRIIKKDFPDIDIMMQTVFEDEENIFKSIQAGASGYLLKDDPIDKYVIAIEEMVDGGAPISSSVALKLLQYMRETNAAASAGSEDFSLTSRELDILKGIVDDLTEFQIGDQLFISPHTVRTHIKNIYKKLHVHTRASAVKIALQNRLV
ncbi:MAG TPA: DNA-binding response regulator [Balneolaceae bacterium]|nr:DNA-binding response regulator [Balneolaceae bacterium]|tara:strand:+ start:118569 stop:119261 length:693 start_codon:yes stop_codon:yes gene_type:complete